MRRPGIGCPWPLAYVHLGERFGKWPWEIEDEPADRVAYYLGVMAKEAEYRDALADVGPRDEYFREWPEDY